MCPATPDAGLSRVLNGKATIARLFSNPKIPPNAPAETIRQAHFYRRMGFWRGTGFELEPFCGRERQREPAGEILSGAKDLVS